MVSDGLSIVNADFQRLFRVCPAVIGTRNFLGNGIAYPAGGGPATTACSPPRS
jgi:hypothetical protein